MKKKLLTIVLTVMMLISNLPTHVVLAEDTEDGDQTVEVAASESVTEETSQEDIEEVSEEYTYEEDDEESKVDYAVNESVSAMTIQGEAAKSVEKAAEAIQEETGLSSEEAQEIAEALFNRDGEEVTPPEQGDGTFISNISVKWLPIDTPDLQYIEPSGDNAQTVTLQIEYELNGSIDYQPGDVMITIPAYIFKKRGASSYKYGKITIPYPEAPSTKNDFNWNKVGDTYVLTNTKKINATTKAYIQISFSNLVPHELVDMEESAPFDATIQVITHLGNTLQKTSNQITAELDTNVKVNTATKRQYGEVQRVTIDDVQYIKVNWYSFANITANTLYDLEITDNIENSEGKVIVEHDGTPVEHTAMISGAETDTPHQLIKTVTDTYKNGNTTYYYYSVLYPASDFQPDVEYKFHNWTTFKTSEIDLENVSSKTASATITWKYEDPKWIDPEGHFNIFKNGNDNSPATTTYKYTHKTGSTNNVVDTRLGKNGYYGIYPAALNDLRGSDIVPGEDVLLSYTMHTIGYIMPWTINHDANARVYANYFKRPVMMETEEEGPSLQRNGEKLQPTVDFEYVSVQVDKPLLYKGVPHNINQDGSWSAENYADGTFLYEVDTNYAHCPVIALEIYRNGAWELYATVDYTSGSAAVDFVDESIPDQTSSVVPVPENTEKFRMVIDTETENGEALELAGISYDVRPVIRLKHDSPAIKAMVNNAFAGNSSPSVNVWNSMNFHAYYKYEYPEDPRDPLDLYIPNPDAPDKDGYNSLRGYTTDTSVFPSKTAKWLESENDYENSVATVHYSARVEIRSVINSKDTYEQAIADNRLNAVKEAVWRDLLPQGMTPILSTIRLRRGDTIKNVYTLENYNNSGRTLLVVEADLTPVPERYKPDGSDSYYYEDVPTISFDAFISFKALKDYGVNGKTVHNVIAFEDVTTEVLEDGTTVRHNHLGDIADHSGEPDEPNSPYNNSATSSAFANNKERSAMTDLDPTTDDPVFVYAGATTTISYLDAARTSLVKDVDVNNEGVFSSGVYSWDAYSPRDVYVGGQYTYRLRTISAEGSQTKNIVFYDILENYVPNESNDDDAVDVGADVQTWKGTLRSVDVSQLELKGCAPVVYYSTVDIAFAVEDTETEGHISAGTHETTGNSNLNNTDIWTERSVYEAEHTENGHVDLSAVKAIAVDASKKANGDPFVLSPLDTATVLINMLAPSGDAAADYIDADAHAYNEVYMGCTTIGSDGVDSNEFLFNWYTKVGMQDYGLPVTKYWDDVNDRDGKRPDDVIFHLLANGVDTGETLSLPVRDEEGELVLDKEGNPIWEDVFYIPSYTNPETGEEIQYSVTEQVIPYYESSYTISEDGYVFTNKHVPEKISIPVTKIWDGGEPENRPTSIRVNLYDDEGNFYGYKTLNANNDWSATFTNLYKYLDGEPIVYMVEEIMNGSMASYYVHDPAEDIVLNPETNGFEITNHYHPYGDLIVGKIIDNEEVLINTSNTAALNKLFTFDFEFVRTVDDEEVPVFDEYVYEIIGRDEDQGEIVVDRKKISYGGSISIRYDQYIYIYEIPEDVTYRISEESVEGYTLVSGSGTAGHVRPNDEVTAVFTNKYSATGSVELGANKKLENKELKRNQFIFEVYDPNYNLIKSVTNGISEVHARPDGTVEYSYAPVSFGSISYTETDVNRTYTYTIKEKIRNGQNGYTFDYSIYYAAVTILDVDGDGELEVTVTYSDGKQTINPEDVCFVNTYEAEGETQLNAWKELRGRNLIDDEFGFGLIKAVPRIDSETGEPITDENGNILYDLDLVNADVQGCTADGTVAFKTIKYNQNQIGLYEYYVVREIIPEETDDFYDETVVYDDTLYAYRIDIGDYGNGVLNIVQTLVKVEKVEGDTAVIFPMVDVVENGVVIGQTNVEGALPVFHNVLKDGYLAVTKLVDPESQDWDETQEFTFHVKLIGDGVDGQHPYTITTAGQNADPGTNPGENPGTEPGEDPGTGGGTGGEPQPLLANPLPLLGGFSGPLMEDDDETESGVYHATTQQELQGVAYAIFDEDKGELVFFRSETPLESPATVTLTVHGTEKQYSGTVYAGFDGATYNSSSQVPWNANADKLTTISMDDRYGIKPAKSIKYWFSGLSKLVSIDLSRLDTQNVDNFQSLFDGCTSLTSIDLSHLDTVHVKLMDNMFNGCSSLTSINFKNFNTSAVTSMGSMFSSCTSLTELDLRNFNTSNVVWMNSMFYGCTGLTSVDLSSFNTSKTTQFGNMFHNCSSLTRLDLHNFDTSAVMQYYPNHGISYVFQGCTSLEYLDISGMIINPEATYYYGFFRECNNLKKVVLGSGFRFRTNDYDGNYLCTPTGEGYTGLWIREDGFGPFTATEFSDNYNETYAGTWVWQATLPTYVIQFTVAEEDKPVAGSMADVTPVIEQTYKLPANRYQKEDYHFTKWIETSVINSSGEEIGQNREYADGAVISADTYQLGDIVYLQAVFAKNEVTVTNGEFDIVLHGNETAMISGIPGGTAYQVYEDTTDGWILVATVDASGTIIPNETVEAKFTNKYQPSLTSVQFAGTKMLDNKAAAADSYMFELAEIVDGTKVIINQQGPNGYQPYVKVLEGGFIRFDVIIYDEDDVGTHTYQIKEIDPADDEIDYDTHIETVTVVVTKNDDGSLSSTVSYENDGDERIHFVNRTRPGMLRITKNVDENDITDGNADDLFTFEVTLNNANGMPIDEDIYWYVADQTGDDGASGGNETGAQPLLGNPFPVNLLGGLNGPLKEDGDNSDDTVAYVLYRKVLPTGNNRYTNYYLYFFRDVPGKYPNGSGQTVTLNGTAQTGTVYTGFEDDPDGNHPWPNNINDYYHRYYIYFYDTIKPLSTKGWFEGLGGTTYGSCNIFDIDMLNTSRCIDISYMFHGSKSIRFTDGDISNWDTSKVTDMSHLFDGWEHIYYVPDSSNDNKLDLSGWDTSNVTDMSYMFAAYNNKNYITELNISGWDTSNVTNMSRMFFYMNSLTSLDVGGWNTANVEDMSFMFCGCSALPSLDVRNFNTSNVKYMNNMFAGCSALPSLDVSDWNTANVENMSSMFSNCRALKTVDVSNFNTSNVKNMAYMFYCCYVLTPIDVSEWNIANVEDMQYMFSSCRALTTVDVNEWNTANVKDMQYMFNDCSKLASLDVSEWNTENVEDMQYMFNNCSALPSLDVSGWNTANVEDMKYMFSNCSKLASLDVSHFDTSKVRYVHNMFEGCESLTSLDISSFNTSEVLNAKEMFKGCSKLATLTTGDELTFAKTCDFNDMFNGCGMLESLDLSKLTGSFSSMTGTGTGIARMFNGCSSLRFLDISSLNFKNPLYKNQSDMFNGCNRLSEVVLGPNFAFWRTYNQGRVTLPDPPMGADSPYNGKWYHVETGTVKTAYQLGEQYANNAELWQGTWIWERNNSGLIRFFGNGGFTSHGDIAVETMDQVIKMPDMETTTRPRYLLVGWNTEADGSGTQYDVAGEYTGIVEFGHTLDLYAQWETTNLRDYKVEHYQQRVDLSDNYDLAETELHIREKNVGEEVTPPVKEYGGFISPDPQTATVLDDDSLVVKYYYNRISYTVEFNGNGATSGSMSPIQMVGGISQKLPLNKFQKTGSMFMGWSDGRRTIYADEQMVTNLTNENGGTVILYAQWLDNPNDPEEPTSGVVRVQCKAGETIVIPNLPAGTTYTIEEVDIPGGWSMTGEVDTEGSIQANGVVTATFTNDYYAIGEVILYAHKKLEGGTLENGQFRFELQDKDRQWLNYAENGQLDTNEYILDEQGNQIPNPWYNTAIVEFSPLYFNMQSVGKTYTYYIVEDVNGDSAFEYDSTVYRVEVTVVDLGDGELGATVKYFKMPTEEGGTAVEVTSALFTNEVVPARLLVKKYTDKQSDDEFTFQLTLKDDFGNELEGSYPYQKAVLIGNKTIIQHSPNIDDDGEMLSEITPNMSYSGSFTVPEISDRVHVTLTGGGEDFGLVFSDEYDSYDYSVYDYMDQETVEFYMSSGEITTEFSTGSNASGYGFYAVFDYGEYSITEGTISSGDKFTLKGGERILIDGLPDGARYEVQETDIPTNWLLAGSKNEVGWLNNGETSEALFDNVKIPDGDVTFVQLAVHKYASGLIKPEDEYFFNLEDEAGNLISTAQTQVENEQGVSDLVVYFDEIEFEKEDFGKTYNYFIYEIEDPMVEDVQFDTRKYRAEVTIGEDGAASVQYYLIGEEDMPVDEVEFLNLKYTDMKIRKTVKIYETHSPVTFAFLVEAKFNGKTVYNDVVQITANAAGVYETTIEHLPIGSVATVTEIYSGSSYVLSADDQKTKTITLSEVVDNNVVDFSNEYGDYVNYGYGIQNTYSSEQGNNTWTWTNGDASGTFNGTGSGNNDGTGTGDNDGPVVEPGEGGAGE